MEIIKFRKLSSKGKVASLVPSHKSKKPHAVPGAL